MDKLVVTYRVKRQGGMTIPVAVHCKDKEECIAVKVSASLNSNIIYSRRVQSYDIYSLRVKITPEEHYRFDFDELERKYLSQK